MRHLPSSEPTAIEVRNLSKSYRLGTIGATTLRDSLSQFAQKIFSPKISKEEEPLRFDALADISFKVAQGEVVGIIGHNGAGKSTLLKILSRITEPTSGEARLYGRVASLLEVGTGFHPELTGRENIFLNGAILGMRKHEIAEKLPKISEFAAVEKFLDTPVKRYSSGMRVRLAFAVAAHLNPEILIIDEVLAVGDAAFQQKCLGKLDEIARSGRTVLFVSHNMASIQSFCSRVIVLDQGRVAYDGSPSLGIERYFRSFADNDQCGQYIAPPETNDKSAWIESATLVGSDGLPRVEVTTNDTLQFEIIIRSRKPLSDVELGLGIFNARGVRVCTLHTVCDPKLNLTGNPGRYRFHCQTASLPLAKGSHHVRMQLKNGEIESSDTIPIALAFQVLTGDFFKNGGRDSSGAILVKQSWSLQSIDTDPPSAGVPHREESTEETILSS